MPSNSPNRRSGLDRRSGNDRRIKQIGRIIPTRRFTSEIRYWARGPKVIVMRAKDYAKVKQPILSVTGSRKGYPRVYDERRMRERRQSKGRRSTDQ